MKHNIQTINDLKLRLRICYVIGFFLSVSVIVNYLKAPIISPCQKDGCFVKVVHADEPTMTVKEKLYLYGIRAFGVEHVEALSQLVFKESGFNPYAVNKSSGAAGLFQALPFSKTGCKLSEVDCQINWGLGYIKKRYGNPTNALTFHINNGWY